MNGADVYKLVGWGVRSLGAGLPEADAEDLIQEGALGVLSRERTLDPSRPEHSRQKRSSLDARGAAIDYLRWRSLRMAECAEEDMDIYSPRTPPVEELVDRERLVRRVLRAIEEANLTDCEMEALLVKAELIETSPERMKVTAASRHVALRRAREKVLRTMGWNE